jgi:hypothetical protein
MEIAAVRQTFDSDNVVAAMHHGKSQAAIYPLPVDDYRAGAALPLIATFLRAGEGEMLPQGVEQCCARIDRQRERTPR